MDFNINDVDLQIACDLASRIADLKLSDVRELPNYRGPWRNTGLGGIKFRSKTVLEFGFGGESLKRLLAVRGKDWEHIWYRDNNHMGDFGYVRVCTIASIPVEDRAYVGYVSRPAKGKGAPRIGWYFSTDLNIWMHWNDGNPDGMIYNRRQLNI